MNNGFQYTSIINNSHSLKKVEPSKEDIFILYVMDVNCPFSNNEEVITAVNNLVERSKLRQEASGYNVKFMLVTVNNPYLSTSLLSKFKSVDEVNFGNGWQNLTLSKYLLNEGYTQMITPQLLVFKRHNIIQKHGEFKYTFGFNKEQKLFHLTSMDSIIEFDYRKIFTE